MYMQNSIYERYLFISPPTILIHAAMFWLSTIVLLLFTMYWHLVFEFPVHTQMSAQLSKYTEKRD